MIVNKEVVDFVDYVEETLDSLERDIREPDKTLCHVASIRFWLAGLCPKYARLQWHEDNDWLEEDANEPSER